MPTPTEIRACIADALDTYEGEGWSPDMPPVFEAARAYLAEAERAMRVVAALEKGIPAPNENITGAWTYRFVEHVHYAQNTDFARRRLNEWLANPARRAESWPTFADAVLAAASAAGLSEER